MSETKALLYAELLSNIRQVSIIAALETPCNQSTSIQLSSDGERFFLYHEGSVSSIILPAQVAHSSQLQKPVLGSQELSWRLPLSSNCTPASIDLAQSNDVPWSSIHFQQVGGDTSYCCRQCGCVVVERGAIKTWKDLPSENWAEMMEFWHCHKPDVHEDDHDGSSDIASGGEASQTNRGYGANTKLAAQSGICFVDLTTFLLSETDCPSLSTHSDILSGTSSNNTPFRSSSSNQTIQCRTCSHYIGYLDSTFSGLRLYKWRVSLHNNSSSQSTSSALSPPSLSSLLCTQLQSIIASQNTAKIVLIPSTSLPLTSGPQSTTLLLWVLSSAMRFSSSTVSGSLGMKIFFRDISKRDTEGMVDSGKVEEIALPLEAIVDIGALLRESGKLLPPSARKFREWDVGVLERYEDR